MTNIRIFLLVTLAFVIVLGVSGRQGLAQTALQFHLYTIERGPVVSGDAVPNATPAVSQGIVAMGPLSLTSPPNPDSWPCFAPNKPCTADPSSGMLIGVPQELWSLASCNNASCGQIYYTFETGSGSGAIVASIKVSQGTGTSAKTILSVSGNIGTAKPNTFYCVPLDGVGFGTNFCNGCVAPVAGVATISTSTKVGTVTIKGSAKITLQ